VAYGAAEVKTFTLKKTSVLTKKSALLMKELVRQINTTSLSHSCSALSNQRAEKHS
jgi:hypothetical protein